MFDWFVLWCDMLRGKLGFVVWMNGVCVFLAAVALILGDGWVLGRVGRSALE